MFWFPFHRFLFDSALRSGKLCVAIFRKTKRKAPPPPATTGTCPTQGVSQSTPHATVHREVSIEPGVVTTTSSTTQLSGRQYSSGYPQGKPSNGHISQDSGRQTNKGPVVGTQYPSSASQEEDMKANRVKTLPAGSSLSVAGSSQAETIGSLVSGDRAFSMKRPAPRQPPATVATAALSTHTPLVDSGTTDEPILPSRTVKVSETSPHVTLSRSDSVLSKMLPEVKRNVSVLQRSLLCNTCQTWSNKRRTSCFKLGKGFIGGCLLCLSHRQKTDEYTRLAVGKWIYWCLPLV